VAIDLPTVVLTAQAEVRPSPMSTLAATLGDALGALRAWEKADGVRATALPLPTAPKTLPTDPARAERLARIESTLKDARATLDLADVATVDALRASLAVVYGEARAHPEDPEAGVLVAETLRMLARVESLAGNVDGATALRARARTLDGGRMVGLSEGVEAPLAPAAPVTFTVLLDGAPEGARVRIDGRAEHAAGSLALQLTPGEHHLRVVLAEGDDPLDGGTLYGTFFVVAAPGQSLRLRLESPAVACSARDLEPALAVLASDPSATFAVACARWARVVKTGATTIEVRVCGQTACGDRRGWVAPPPTGNGNGPKPGGEGGTVWSSPWTYVAIGAAVVVIGGVTAWRLGAFDRAETPPPTWRWEGVGASK
jgi:hypothetical protein